MKAVIFDVDGTLADCSHRIHHVSNGNKNFDAFFSAADDDMLIEPVAIILDSLSAAGYEILICSGRPENQREMTVRWLNGMAIDYSSLYMRPDNDPRPDHLVKAQILETMREDGFDPFLAIEDRDDVVEMFRERGLVCLQCSATTVDLPNIEAQT